MTMFWRGLALALVLLLGASPAAAEETIRAFGTTIFVKQDGSLDVVERIFVDVENVAIRHGIYRDFPTRYTTRNGGRMRVGFSLVEAKLDNGPVESKVENLYNGVRIRLGSEATIIPPGLHLYQIHYRVTRELGYFDTYDELYWNVTGNGWDFPIAQAGVQIHLPDKVRFGQRAFYTGYQGSTQSDARVVEERLGLITIVATRPLRAREGLTVAVAFPKGVVDPPSRGEKLGWWLSDMLPMLIAGLSLASVVGFLIYAWLNAGRDPPEGTVVPLFAPPDDLSPAEMRYVVEHKLDDRAFAAALVEAGVKGHVIIGEDKGLLLFDGKRYIEGRTTPGARLPATEQAAISALVSPGQRLELDNKNHATFAAAKATLENAFKVRHDEKAFRRNHAWAWAAMGVWLAGAFATALSLIVVEGSIPTPLVFIPPAAAAVAIYLFNSEAGSAGASCLMKLVAVAFFFLAIGLGLMTATLAIATLRWQPLVVAALGLPIAISSWFWISAPTKQGRALLDRIAGFKQYLTITERDRLNRMQAPRDTLQMFERWLPYAIALEVENRWADRFSSLLAAEAAAGRTGFSWYAGTHSPWSDTDGFASSLGGSLSSSISSASTAPGSSSGSGGGGSSGGGGGGGGGGGW